MDSGVTSSSSRLFDSPLAGLDDLEHPDLAEYSRSPAYWKEVWSSVQQKWAKQDSAVQEKLVKKERKMKHSVTVCLFYNKLCASTDIDFIVVACDSVERQLASDVC